MLQEKAGTTLNPANSNPALLTTTLFLSGGAGLINRVVWQRALKVYFGVSESVSSMTVVLVFLGGLGAGSVWVGKKTSNIRNPAQTLSSIEAGLGIANLGIAVFLGMDVTRNIYIAQRTAVTLGVPLRFLYFLGSALILTAPCFLMGTALPVTIELCQRQFGMRDNLDTPFSFALAHT